MSEPVAAYYDRLSLWTRMAHWFGYGGGRETLTVHRALADPAAGGRPTTTRLHDLLLEALPSLANPHVLDAGCGLGGTMIDLAARIRGTFVGLTLSDRQQAAGRRAIARAGLSDRVRILVQSYDQPPPGPYHLIVAIESLAHSPDPRASVTALAKALAPGGTLAIVDDMPEPDPPNAADLEAFKAGWQAPVLWRATDFAEAFVRLGLQPTLDRDLSPFVQPRTLDRIRRLERLNRALRRAIPLSAWRVVMDSYHGGLALERLYRTGGIRYRLLTASRPHAIEGERS